MKVKELIEILKTQDQDTEVILQKDAEGNGYMSLYDYWNGVYDEGEGEAGFSELTDELRKEGYAEGDVIEGKPAIFLWG